VEVSQIERDRTKDRLEAPHAEGRGQGTRRPTVSPNSAPGRSRATLAAAPPFRAL
jgi:hypothetical protein